MLDITVNSFSNKIKLHGKLPIWVNDETILKRPQTLTPSATFRIIPGKASCSSTNELPGSSSKVDKTPTHFNCLKLLHQQQSKRAFLMADSIFATHGKFTPHLITLFTHDFSKSTLFEALCNFNTYVQFPS